MQSTNLKLLDFASGGIDVQKRVEIACERVFITPAEKIGRWKREQRRFNIRVQEPLTGPSGQKIFLKELAPAVAAEPSEHFRVGVAKIKECGGDGGSRGQPSSEFEEGGQKAVAPGVEILAEDGRVLRQPQA